MRGTVLHIMNYAASYRGNFMDSLSNLDKKIQSGGLKNIYLFTAKAKNKGAMDWIEKMQQQGEEVCFLEGNILKDALQIRSIIKKKRVKIVHTHFLSTKQFVAIYFGNMGKLVPVIVHMHNHSKKACTKMKKFLRGILYHKCIMIACSRSVYESLERDYPKCEKYAINNGIHFSRLDVYEELQPKDLGIGENEKICLIFGFDFYRKGVDLAIKALRKLQNEGKSFQLLISLSSNFEYVEEQIKTVLGEIPSWIKIIPARNDVAALYNLADVFLSPSREEGLPYSVLEAGYSTCGVVMSNISSQANLNIPYGQWFESENVEDLAEKIVKAYENHGEKMDNWDSVKADMRSFYPLDRWSEEIKALYKQLLDKGRSI